MSVAGISPIFVAVFGRPADVSGSTWMTSITKDGTDYSAAAVLSHTGEFTSRFAAQAAGDVVKTLYQSLFNRDPDEGGLAFWKAKLDAGANAAQIAVAIATSATGSDKATFEAKVAVAARFTALLDTTPEIVAYAGGPAVTFGASVLKSVDATHAPTDTQLQTAINDYIFSQSSASSVVGVDQTFHHPFG